MLEVIMKKLLSLITVKEMSISRATLCDLSKLPEKNRKSLQESDKKTIFIIPCTFALSIRANVIEFDLMALIVFILYYRSY